MRMNLGGNHISNTDTIQYMQVRYVSNHSVEIQVLRKYSYCMKKKIKQLNEHKEWADTARQCRRYYSMYGIGKCLSTPSGGGNASMKILEMYEKPST